MTRCAQCGSENEKASQFCFHCGSLLSAAGTCPRCSTAMAVVIKRSGLGLALIILGIILTPVVGIGIPIFIVGYVMRFSGKGRACYRCPRCNYSSV